MRTFRTVSDASAFPNPPTTGVNAEAAALEKYKAELAAIQKQLDDDAAAVKGVRDAESTAFAAYSDAILEVAKGSVERARAGAEIVQKSAAAIAGVYTTVLGVAFSVTENPFPSRGLTSLILLGLSIVLSTAYLSYLTNSRALAGGFQSSALPRVNIMRRVGGFVDWTRAITRRRSYLLRASIVALALSLPFLAAPFISIGKVEVEKQPSQLTDWPSPAGWQDPKINQIQFTAQVKEVADIRAKEIEANQGKTIVQDDTDQTWWLLLAVALCLTFVGPFALEALQSKSGKAAEKQTSTTGSTA
jgi:hypothetical protein